MCVHTWVTSHACDHRATLRSQFFSSTFMWVLGNRTHTVRLVWPALYLLRDILLVPINYFLIQLEKRKKNRRRPWEWKKRKKDKRRRGWGERKKREMEPLICLDFPLHRVISLEVTEIKWSVLQPPPSTPHFLFTEKPGAGSNPPAPQIAPMSASEGTKNHRPPLQRPAAWTPVWHPPWAGGAKPRWFNL